MHQMVILMFVIEEVEAEAEEGIIYYILEEILRNLIHSQRNKNYILFFYFINNNK